MSTVMPFQSAFFPSAKLEPISELRILAAKPFELPVLLEKPTNEDRMTIQLRSERSPSSFETPYLVPGKGRDISVRLRFDLGKTASVLKCIIFMFRSIILEIKYHL